MTNNKKSPSNVTVKVTTTLTPAPNTKGLNSNPHAKTALTARKKGEDCGSSGGGGVVEGEGKDGGSVTSCVVAALTELGGSSRGKRRESRLGSANRADRLQVRLNTLEKEVGWLQQKGKTLDQRLARFLAQKSSLASSLDDLHLRLDSLARSQKSMARREGQVATVPSPLSQAT